MEKWLLCPFAGVSANSVRGHHAVKISPSIPCVWYSLVLWPMSQLFHACLRNYRRVVENACSLLCLHFVCHPGECLTAGGGTAILVLHGTNLYAISVHDLRHLDATAIHIMLANGRVTIRAVYVWLLIQSDLSAWLGGGLPIHIAGDPNAKHVDWYWRLITTSSRILRHCAREHSCLIYGPDNPPVFLRIPLPRRCPGHRINKRPNHRSTSDNVLCTKLTSHAYTDKHDVVYPFSTSLNELIGAPTGPISRPASKITSVQPGCTE